MAANDQAPAVLLYECKILQSAVAHCFGLSYTFPLVQPLYSLYAIASNTESLPCTAVSLARSREKSSISVEEGKSLRASCVSSAACSVCFRLINLATVPLVKGETCATLCSVSRGLHLFSVFFCPTRTNRGHTGGGKHRGFFLLFILFCAPPSSCGASLHSIARRVRPSLCEK